MKLSTLLSNLPPGLPIRAQPACFGTVGDYVAALTPPPDHWAFVDPEIVVRCEGRYLHMYAQPPLNSGPISWIASIELPPAERPDADD